MNYRTAPTTDYRLPATDYRLLRHGDGLKDFLEDGLGRSCRALVRDRSRHEAVSADGRGEAFDVVGDDVLPTGQQSLSPGQPDPDHRCVLWVGTAGRKAEPVSGGSCPLCPCRCVAEPGKEIGALVHRFPPNSLNQKP